jgi:hypothetical protein
LNAHQETEYPWQISLSCGGRQFVAGTALLMMSLRAVTSILIEGVVLAGNVHQNDAAGCLKSHSG